MTLQDKEHKTARPTRPKRLIMNKICVVVPTYNNGQTIAELLKRTAAQGLPIIVVVDGSTDQTRAEIAASGVEVTTIDFAENRGKSAALLAAFDRARELGFDSAITIDADLQHFPEDLPRFVEEARRHPDAIIVGARRFDAENMPQGSTRANRFSNFWFRLYTGVDLEDTQSGYRLYPLRRVSAPRWLTRRYEGELAMLVFSSWKGVELRSIPVRIYYPPAEERVTHFRPVADFLRITWLNTVLGFLAVVYGLPCRVRNKLRRNRR